MDSIVLAFNHGNGPYTRAYQLARLVRLYAGTSAPIVVPWIYEGQASILNQFGDDYLLSRELGDALKPALYWGGSFLDYAKELPNVGDAVERRFMDLSMGKLKVRDARGRQFEVRIEDPLYINAYPAIMLPAYVLSLHEHVILRRYADEFGIDVGSEVIDWFSRVEKGALTFISAPAGACSSGFKPVDEIVIPPAVHKYRREVYRFRGVRVIGSGVEAANASLMSRKYGRGRKVIVTRGGLATVWEAWLQGIPVLIPPPRPGEDPEITYNIRVFEGWRMAHLLMDWKRDLNTAIRYAAERTDKLIPRPLGISVAAATIVRHMKGKRVDLAGRYDWLCKEEPPRLH